MVQESYYVVGFDKDEDCTFDIIVLKQDFLASDHYNEIDPETRVKLEDEQYMTDYEVEVYELLVGVKLYELPGVYAVMCILEDCGNKLSRADWKYTTDLSIIPFTP